ncbi:YkvA family protein [Pontibacter litorisediminis]|uniref:YkvA family protein n=1 Tax=Pontibacter litorisediminis TaxID=1846260 RepID=UPI0023EC40BE|nr:YkvA family protein [Pontibacter litorisediminis]
MLQLYTLKQKAHSFHTEVYALYLAYRDARVKWYARLLLAVTIAYSVSPLDFVPDLVPVFGYLDDVVLVAMGLSGSYRLLPRAVLQEAKLQAYEDMNESVLALRAISYTWVLLLTLVAILCYKLLYMHLLF